MGSDAPILPGSTLGVLGGGQLGRMFVMAAARLGYRVVVLSPQPDAPAGRIAHAHIVADYDDDVALGRLSESCDVVTIEFENVPVESLERIRTRTRPGPAALAVMQDRTRERAFLRRHGIACAPHRVVRTAEEATEAARSIGTPGVLKRACLGYDGRGQARVDCIDEAARQWDSLRTDGALYESWVPHACELSVLVARSPAGHMETFGPIENRHVDGILDLSRVPARVPPPIASESLQIARHIAEAIDLEGLMCVELFLLEDGSLLVNELAPRPHNSGHLTIEACAASQFEQQVRSVCGLPLAPMTLRSPAAMVNLLGAMWRSGEPRWERALEEPLTSLHLYDKGEARPGRKMGHITALGASAEDAAARALCVRDRLGVHGRTSSDGVPPRRTQSGVDSPGSRSEDASADAVRVSRSGVLHPA